MLLYPLYLMFHQTDSDHNSTFNSEASPNKRYNQPICGTLHTVQDHISTAALVDSLEKKGQYSNPVPAHSISLKNTLRQKGTSVANTSKI